MDDSLLVRRLQKRVRILGILTAVELIVIAGLIVFTQYVWHEASHRSGSIKVREIRIVDSQGRDRLLIGSALNLWHDQGKPLPGAALAVLDEKGVRRVSIGETPMANRIGAAVGLTIYDVDGHERGGFGFLSNGRAVWALDREKAGDAIGAMVDDKSGFAGFVVTYPDRKGTAISMAVDQGNAAIDIYETSGKKKTVLHSGTRSVEQTAVK